MDFELDGGGHLHGHRAGTGKISTVLLHGWATTGRIWAPVLRRWPDTAGGVVALDLRGAGWSHKPDQGFSTQDYARDVIAVLRQLSGPVTLVGHSMGGQIAQWIASQAPELVSKLVLVSPVPAGGVPFADADVAYFKSLAGRADGMRTVLSSMMVVSPDDATVAGLVADSATVTPSAYLQGFDGWRGADFADLLGGIKAPTVVLGGGAEQPLSPEVLKAAVVGLIPGALFVEIPDVGHYPQFEAPEVFAETLFSHCLR